MLVSEGDHVERGQAITEGQLAPQDITEILGLDAAYDYIIREVQSVYRRQNVDVNDRHIEVIARQMTRKVRVVDSGDTELLDASMVDVTEFDSENERIQARIDAGETELKLATSSPVLLGITKASILTESWLSAASFQETTKVLTEAAIRGKVDHLLGLKENVIIGKLILPVPVWNATVRSRSRLTRERSRLTRRQSSRRSKRRMRLSANNRLRRSA